MAKKKPTPSYYELLRHPNWQRKRLEVLERAGFECEDCGSTEKTLNVHHGYYEKGLMPWEYPDNTLHCLCEDCHKDIQEKLLRLHRLIGVLSPCYIGSLIGHAAGLALDFVECESVEVNSWEEAAGLGYVYGVSDRNILEACDGENGISRQQLHDLSNLESRHRREMAEAYRQSHEPKAVTRPASTAADSWMIDKWG